MFLVLLDASRAFDRVQYVKLFWLLGKCGLGPLTCKRSAPQIMLDICEKFGKEYDVTFNSQNRHPIMYNTNYQYIDMPQLYLNGETVQIQKYACHPGHPIGNENVNKIGCNNSLCDIVWRTNYVMAKFGSCTADIGSVMFRTYCTSFYGSPLWRLSSPDINELYVTWRKRVRRI